MNIHPIKSEDDYQTAIEEVERLLEKNIKPNTPDGDRFEVLTTLIEAYEAEHYPIPLPDPIEAIKYYMESRGLTRKDLEPFIGSSGRVSEILNRKRTLSLRMIRNLHEGLGIPTEILVQDYDDEPDDICDVEEMIQGPSREELLIANCQLEEEIIKLKNEIEKIRKELSYSISEIELTQDNSTVRSEYFFTGDEYKNYEEYVN